MTRVRDHQSPAEQAGNKMLDEKDAAILELRQMNRERDVRIQELLEANSRFEQRGRMAARFVKFMESCLLDGHFGAVRQEMARQLIADYKKDNP